MMIVALMLATAAVCSDYWVAGADILRHKGKPPALDISRETRVLFSRVSYRIAEELGYNLHRLDFELYQKDDYYIGFLRPAPNEYGQPPLGGDLIIILESDGKVRCFFRGA